VSSTITDITVTAAFQDIESTARAVAFIPDEDAPWTGLIITAPRDGGLDLFNADGEIVTRMTGPRLSGLAVSPNFALRGEALPLIIGVDTQDNILRAYVLVRSGPNAIEAPLAPITMEAASNLCFVREGAGFVEIAVLGRDASAEIWRISDSGGDLIGTELIRSYTLPAPARTCTSIDGAVYVGGPTSSLLKLESDGTISAQTPFNAVHMASSRLGGRAVIIAASGQDETLQVFDAQTLARVTTARVVMGLSTPGISRPGAMAISEASYGGASYQSGLVAIIDEDDGRVRVIARESFARDVVLAD